MRGLGFVTFCLQIVCGMVVCGGFVLGTCRCELCVLVCDCWLCWLLVAMLQFEVVGFGFWILFRGVISWLLVGIGLVVAFCVLWVVLVLVLGL